VGADLISVWTRAFLDAAHEARHRTIGLTLIVAASVHLGLTILHGAQPGWFWMILPAMIMSFGVLLVAGSRSRRSNP
jgi:hypothetical protein